MAKKRRASPKIERICNLRPSRETEKDWRFEHAVESNAVAAPRAALPGAMDLRIRLVGHWRPGIDWVVRWLGFHRRGRSLPFR
jgi:hypothetical protein